MPKEEKHVTPYDLFILGISIYVLVVLLVELAVPLNSETRRLLFYIDTAVCGVFMTDFVMRLTRAENKLKYLLPWGILDFVSSIPAIGPLRAARVSRVVRILRLLRAARATRTLIEHTIRRRGESTFAAVSLVTFLTLVFASLAVLTFETDPASTIDSAGDALWWSFATMTTVGYGDEYPVTPQGRVVAVFLMVAGITLFGVFTGFVGSWFAGKEDKESEPDFAGLSERLAGIEAKLDALAKQLG